jgi:hypothetical protein
VLCEVKVDSEEEANQLEDQMVSEEFSTALVADVQNIDPALASVGVEVSEYVSPGKKTFFYNFSFFLCFEILRKRHVRRLIVITWAENYSKVRAL